MEIRNTSHIELTTDVITKEGRKVILKPHGVLDVANVDEKSLKASLENGKLKTFLEKKYIIQGSIIKGDAKEVEKLSKADAKIVEAKVKEEKKKEAKEEKKEEAKEEKKEKKEKKENKENKEEEKVEDVEELK